MYVVEVFYPSVSWVVESTHNGPAGAALRFRALTAQPITCESIAADLLAGDTLEATARAGGATVRVRPYVLDGTEQWVAR